VGRGVVAGVSVRSGHSQHLPGWCLYAEPRLCQACIRETCPGEGWGRRLSLAVATSAKAREQEAGAEE
jgi:hypothetical protein